MTGKKHPRRRNALAHSILFMAKTWPWMRPYPAMVAGVLALTAVNALLSLAAPWPMAFLVDSVLGDKEYPMLLRGLGDAGIWTRIGVAVGIGVLLTMVTGFASIADEFLSTRLSLRMVLDLRSQLFRHLQRLPLSFHEKASSGQYIFQSTGEADNVSMAVEAVPPLLTSVFTLGGMFVIVYRLNPQLAFLASSIVPLVYQATRYYSQRIQPALWRVREIEGGVLNVIFESMTMIRVVQAFGREQHHWSQFRDKSAQALDTRVRLTVLQTGFGVAVTMLTAAGSALVLAFGAFSVVQNRLSVGELLVVVSYIKAVYEPLEQISTTLARLPQQIIPLRIALNILGTESEIDDRPGAVDIGTVEGRVRLEDVSFSYEGRTDTLTAIHLEANPGDVIAVVGPTGAGKSTLVSLIPRFIEATSGKVLVDGHPVQDVTLESLRRNISIVLQEPLLFSGTIRENILYGRLDATDEEVQAAARAAGAHEFIMNLPEQYESRLGERGSRISGGERQRISVARAFLRDAPILILDEPTSAIDSRTEAVILDALEDLMHGRTTFMIAHRLATVRHATKILVMHEGRIVQQGNHAELVARPGLYREMVEAQGGHVPDLLHEAEEEAPAEAFDDPERSDALADGPADSIAVAALNEQRPGGADHREEPEARPMDTSAPATSTTPGGTRKIVLLGMLSKIPVAGVVWQTAHYMKGLELLGFDPYYVEAHGRTPSMFMQRATDDGPARAAEFIDSTMRGFGFAGKWAYHDPHDGDRHFGMSPAELARLYRSAELVINLHGGTIPTEEHSRTGRLVYLETDPVTVQVEVDQADQVAIDYLDAHQFHFTFAENLGRPGCLLPTMERWDFKPTRQPVVFAWWADHDLPARDRYTTVGNWKQAWREVVFRGETYHWSKHLEFEKVIDLPKRARGLFELALASFDSHDRERLERHGWRVTGAMDFSMDRDRYRQYIQRSRGEFTVAKDQNVRLQTGWFSDRSATYLAAGRPVVTQDTGFGTSLPVGEGLFAFSTLDEAAAAIEAVESDYDRHSRRATQIARDHFGAMGVLGRMLDDIGVDRARRAAAISLSGASPDATSRPAGDGGLPFPADLVLRPLSRRPLVLPAMTTSRVLSAPVPRGPSPAGEPEVSIVVVTHDNLVFTRLCLESLLQAQSSPAFEVVVVDNASNDLTAPYLGLLARRDPRVRTITNESNAGFARAVNQGLSAAKGEVLVILNNDVLVGPRCLERLVGLLDDEAIGLIGPVTNAAPNEARVPSSYTTLEGYLEQAEQRWEAHGRATADIPVLTMFCTAMRRDVFEAVGPLDEQFGLGMFEDDDYSLRVRAAGFRVACAEGVFVHHFGEASFGKLVPTGEHGELFRRNRELFERKWGRPWSPHSGRALPGYQRLVGQVRRLVAHYVPEGRTMVVVSKGDDELVRHDGRTAWHFPTDATGAYAGNYPADGQAAIDELLRCRDAGAGFVVFPQTSLWWLDHYQDLAHFLDVHGECVVDDTAGRIFRWRSPNEIGSEPASPAASPSDRPG